MVDPYDTVQRKNDVQSEYLVIRGNHTLIPSAAFFAARPPAETQVVVAKRIFEWTKGLQSVLPQAPSGGPDRNRRWEKFGGRERVSLAGMA